LDTSLPVALGFECPLFVPLREDEQDLLRQREGERGYSFSASAGTSALVAGLVEAAWVLLRVRRLLRASVPAFLDSAEFVRAGTGLFLWEAFVAGAAKAGGHADDARIGAEAMTAALPDPRAANAVQCASPTHSLIAGALLRTGRSTDASLLGQPCLVIRA
jgi:hypothetical protein